MPAMPPEESPPTAAQVTNGGAIVACPAIERPAILSRQLSAPARNKPSSLTNNHHRNHHQKKLSLCSRSLSSDDTTRRQPSYCLECRTDHNGVVSASASESPSSASDSAFSQSQTTLESDSCSDQSSAWRSLKPDNRRRVAGGEEASNDSTASEDYCRKSTPDGDSNSSTTQEDDEESDQFKIIWKSLSYRVPDKRFARARSFIERQKEALWPSKDDDTIDSIESTDPSPPLPTLVSTEGDVDEPPQPPPLRAPCSGKPRKVIFSGLNGCVKSGQLTAILGPSGAGKTTFLKCLTNSIVKGVSGSIDISGGNSTGHHLKLCIIPQKDYLFDNLTVMENLLFASRIKNTAKTSSPSAAEAHKHYNDNLGNGGVFDHLANVERVADLLGLRACLKLKTNKLSGGQYKRVSIAQELLSKPDILILDEPTSGLDSLTCFRTVSVLRDLANRSRAGLIPQLAIIMTIHQPQIKIFNLFHHVYILSSMGQCVYEGRPDHLIDTVADCCKLLPPPDDLNPASFIIALASEVYGIDPIQRLAKLQRENFDLHQINITEKNRRSSNLDALQPFAGEKNGKLSDNCDQGVTIDLDETHNSESYPAEKLPKDGNDCFVISSRLKRRNRDEQNVFWLHTWLLVKRLWISMWRDPLLTTTRVTFHLIIPFVFYFIYSQKSGAANACPYVEREFDLRAMTSEENIRRLEIQHNELILTFENTSLFFLLLYSFSMCVLAVTALSFPLNMQILLKETSNGWYSMPRFVMAKTIADLPMELSMPMISVALAYILTGQPSSYLCWRMLTVTAVMTLCSLISQTQGLLFGAYFMNNVQAAVFVSQASSLPWIMLSGFTTRVSELPKVLQWLSFGSIYRLGIESIVSVRYGFGMCPCDEEVVDGSPAKLVGIPDQLRSVVNYYLDSMSSSSASTDPTPSPTMSSKNSSSEDIFEKIASTMSRANTYGVDVTSCHDVRPFIMSAREVDESTLSTFLLILVLIFVGLKILLFCVVRFRAG